MMSPQRVEMIGLDAERLMELGTAIGGAGYAEKNLFPGGLLRRARVRGCTPLRAISGNVDPHTLVASVKCSQYPSMV